MVLAMKSKKITKDDFKRIISRLGINEGDILFVQTSEFEHAVLGGPEVVIDALLELLGSEGTLVMSLNGYNIEPSYNEKDIHSEGVSIEQIRTSLPQWNDRTLSMYSKDVVASNLAQRQAAVLSNNLSYPFVAYGRCAESICNGQTKDFPLGDQSPLARLYELRAKMLSINVGIRDLLLIGYVVERNEMGPIRINGGVNHSSNPTWTKFIEREVTDELIQLLVSDREFKALFTQIQYANNFYLVSQIHTVIDGAEEILLR